LVLVDLNLSVIHLFFQPFLWFTDRHLGIFNQERYSAVIFFRQSSRLELFTQFSQGVFETFWRCVPERQCTIPGSGEFHG